MPKSSQSPSSGSGDQDRPLSISDLAKRKLIEIGHQPDLGKAQQKKDAEQARMKAVIENALNNFCNQKTFLFTKGLREKNDPLSYEKIAQALSYSHQFSRTGKKYTRASVQQLYERFIEMESQLKSIFGDSFCIEKGITYKIKVRKDYKKYIIASAQIVARSKMLEAAQTIVPILTKRNSENQNYFNFIRTQIKSAQSSICVINNLNIPNVENAKFNPKSEIAVTKNLRSKYFTCLENEINNKPAKFVYQRILQLPPIQEIYSPNLSQAWLYSCAAYFLPPVIVAHIERTHLSAKMGKLFLSNLPHAGSTIMMVDNSKVLLQAKKFDPITGKVNLKNLYLFQSDHILNHLNDVVANQLRYAIEIDVNLFLKYCKETLRLKKGTEPNETPDIDLSYLHMYYEELAKNYPIFRNQPRPLESWDKLEEKIPVYL